MILRKRKDAIDLIFNKNKHYIFFLVLPFIIRLMKEKNNHKEPNLALLYFEVIAEVMLILGSSGQIAEYFTNPYSSNSIIIALIGYISACTAAAITARDGIEYVLKNFPPWRL